MEKKLLLVPRVGMILAAALLGAGTCHAEEFSLTQAIALARQNDPGYRGTLAKLGAANARRAQADSPFLPQLSIKASGNRSNRRYETLNSLFPEPISNSQYNGYSAQLNLTQSLYRRSTFIGISQAEAVVRQSEQEVLAAEQDLLLRLARAWFEAMSTEDAQAHADSRSVAAHRQWDQLVKASNIDLAAAPALADARAKYEQAAAERMAAASERETKIAALEEIVGPLPPFALPTLSYTYTPPAPADHMLQEWLEIAETRSPTVIAARAALDAAGEEVRRQHAGHEPTLDLVGSYSINNQGEGNFPGQSGYDIHQRSIGVEINLPLYQGGLQTAKVREAIAMRSQAEQELLAAVRTARSGAKTAWFAWQAGNARRLAGDQAVKSASLALRSASVGVTQEVKFDLDVLEAREQLVDAWSKVQRARYDMILEWLKLKAVSGQLADDDLLAVEGHWAVRESEVQLLADARR
jgi:outer membrane protein